MVVLAPLVSLGLVAVPTTARAISLPAESQASNTYVAVSNPPGIETVDSNTGAEVGGLVSLACPPVGEGEWWPSGTASAELVVAEQSSSACTGTSENAVQTVNSLTDAVSGQIALAATPSAVVVADDASKQAVHYAVVLEPGADQVQILDTYADTLTTVSLGLSNGDAMSLAMNPDGTYAYVTDATEHKVVTLQWQSTSPYFAVASTYTGSSSFDPTAMTVAQNETTAYLSDGSSIDVAALSPSTVSLSGSISIGSATGQSAANANDTVLYVALGATIGVVTLSSDSVTSWSSPVTATEVALSNDDSVLGVGSASSSTYDMLSTVTGSTLNSLTLSGAPSELLQAGAVSLHFVAYVVKSGVNKVDVYDPNSNVAEQDIPVGTDPVAIASSPDGQYLFVANKASNSVSVIETDLVNTPSPPVIATLNLGSGFAPDALAVNTSSGQLLVAGQGSSTYPGQIVDFDADPANSGFLSEYENVTLSGTSPDPVQIAMSPDGYYAYVLDASNKTVDVLANTSNYTLQGTTGSFGNTPTDIVISPNDAYAYVTTDPVSGNGFVDYKPITTSGDFGSGSGSWTVGQDPTSITVSDQGTTAYVTNTGSNTLSQVTLSNFTSGAVTTVSSNSLTPPSLSGPVGVALTPDQQILLETNDGSAGDTLSLYSEPGNSLLSTFSFSASSAPGQVIVAPLFGNPTGSTILGAEQDVNPAVAATNSLDVVDGVNTATEAYTLPLDDLSMPDIGTTLDLSQEYDSQDLGLSEGLGDGWAYSYGMFATQSPPGTSSTACDLTITEANGSTAVFSPPPTGNWTTTCAASGSTGAAGSSTEAYEPPTWEQASLSVVSSCSGTDSCWDMTVGGTTQYLFDETNGELVSEIDQNGNTTHLAYSSGQLSTVTGPSGQRSLSFTWNSSHLITKVTEKAGTTAENTASFTYSGAYLTKVTLTATKTGDTKTHAWAFANTGPGSRIASWWAPDFSSTKPAAEATVIAYTSSGRVTSVTDPQWVTQCDGASGTPYCAPEWSFGWTTWESNTGTGTIEISDPNDSDGLSNGDVTFDRYVDGVLVGQTKGYKVPGGIAPIVSGITYDVPDPFTWLSSLSIDGDGNVGFTQYDSSGNVLESVTPLGNVTSYIYNRYNQVLSETDPLGSVTTDTYDSHGNQLTETDPLGNTTSYAYTATGLQCAKLSASGYAAGDRLTACPSGSAPYVTAYGYDAEGDPTSTTAYDGTANTVTETYVTTELDNKVGEVCATLTADGYATGARLPSSCPTTGAAYESVEVAYDAFGNVLTSISPTNGGGGTTTNTYDASGNELTTVDPAGDTTTKTYTPDGQLCWSSTLAVSSPTCASPPTGTGTATTTYLYDPDGNELTSVEPDGNATGLACLYETTSAYDNLGNQTSTTVPTGGTTCANETSSTTSATYDGKANRVTATAPDGQVTSTGYDADGNACWSDLYTSAETGICSSPPTTGEVTTHTYDADGNQVTETDPGGTVTSTGYDADGNACWSDLYTSAETGICSSPPTTGAVTAESYDADGNQVAETDPGTGTTTNAYDEQDRELSTTDSSSEETSYTYDGDGTVLTTTAPGSSGMTDSYNGADQLVEVTYTDGTPTVSYQYGTNGQRCWMFQGGTSTAACSAAPTPTGSEVTTTYSYSSTGALASETTATSSTSTTDTYAYDDQGNLACISYPNASGDTCSSPGSGAGIVDYSYNQENEVTQVSDWAGDTFTFAYNQDGQVCWMSTYAPSVPSCSSVPHQPGAVTTATSYDGLGNVSDLKTTTGTSPTNLLDLAVGSRNADDFIETETPTVGTTTENTDSYGYNTSNQVSSGPIVGTSGSDAYTYNANGGITADTTSFQSAGYSASGEVCWTYSGTSTNGCSPPPSGATTYSYNADGQRTATTPASGNPKSFGWEAASGLLTCTNTDGTTCSTSSPTSTTTVYTYSGDGLRSSAMTGSSSTVDFSWGSVGSSPSLLSDGTWDYLYIPGSASPFEQVGASDSSPAADLLLSDESGNTRGLVQLSSGTHEDLLVNYTDYDAYGNPLTEAGGSAEFGGLAVSQTGINGNYVGWSPWGFGEGYTDQNDVTYTPQGSYDPAVGQYLASGGTGGGFSYGNDNPLSVPPESGPTEPPSQCAQTGSYQAGEDGKQIAIALTPQCSSDVNLFVLVAAIFAKNDPSVPEQVQSIPLCTSGSCPCQGTSTCSWSFLFNGIKRAWYPLGIIYSVSYLVESTHNHKPDTVFSFSPNTRIPGSNFCGKWSEGLGSDDQEYVASTNHYTWVRTCSNWQRVPHGAV